MERQSRISYSEEQKELLTTFFNEGMTSTKKAMCDRIRACAARVGISENQVKVAELETLGGHAVVLCAYGGICYQGSAGIGDSLFKTNIMETFASRLHSELIERRGSKIPYAKLQQFGILFHNLPLDIKEEIGVIPQKPSLYGSGQRRKLWLTRHDWSFCISLPGPSSDSCITPTAITLTSTSHTPTPSFVNSSTSPSAPDVN